MYITINNIKGEKRIDLSYSIQNFDSDKEITVIRMLSDNVKYEISPGSRGDKCHLRRELTPYDFFDSFQCLRQEKVG